MARSALPGVADLGDARPRTARCRGYSPSSGPSQSPSNPGGGPVSDLAAERAQLKTRLDLAVARAMA